ncbi:MAG TPA: YceI family protein [Thermoanaerobaculia bacterium]
MKLNRSLIALAIAIIATPLFAQEVYTVDKVHSSTTFKVRHMMANFTGSFRDFDAKINIDRAKPSNSTVEFTIQAASIDTDNENRDKHLRSADFFDVEKFPTITFKSTAIKPSAKKDVFDVTGNLTMHGVTKVVTLPVTFLGFGKDGRGTPKAGFEIETTLNRKDYGIEWNRTLDEGGILLGEDVKVTINIEANGPKPAEAAKQQ